MKYLIEVEVFTFTISHPKTKHSSIMRTFHVLHEFGQSKNFSLKITFNDMSRDPVITNNESTVMMKHVISAECDTE